MELILNLVWVIVAMTGLCVWLRFCPRSGNSRRAQLVALVMILLILFPVVSITDDLWAAQNPAEADTVMRRNDLTAHPHTIVPETHGLPMDLLAGPAVLLGGYAPATEPVVPHLQTVPLASAFTRPPPAL